MDERKEKEARDLAEQHFRELESAQLQGRSAEAQQLRNAREVDARTASFGPSEETAFQRIYDDELRRLDHEADGDSVLPGRRRNMAQMIKLAALAVILLLIIGMLVFPVFGPEDADTDITAAAMTSRIKAAIAQNITREDWEIDGIYEEDGRYLAEIALPLGDAQRLSIRAPGTQRAALARLCPDAQAPLWAMLDPEMDILVTARAAGLDVEFFDASCRDFLPPPTNAPAGDSPQANSGPRPLDADTFNRLMDISGPDDLRGEDSMATIR